MVGILSIFVLFVVGLECVMLKKECPLDEVHRSCAFHEEYTCWEEHNRMERVRSPPKRLAHCRSGCYCKRGYVRGFPGGTCIPAVNCRNRKLIESLKNIPTDFLKE